ncbi:MAG: LysM peptidoglycan-binding domain-containing protein [Pseudomonadota bacterium]
MSTKKLLGMILAALITSSLFAADVALNPDHPDRYVVVKGDTLWDISSLFLRDPWLWPEIWYVNPQIANPHLIYPGDILTLVYMDGKPQLRLQRGRDVKLSPQIRVEGLDAAIPTIPLDAIQQFLTKPLVVGKGELDTAPYIVQNADEHVIAGGGDRSYVRGIEDESIGLWDVFRPGGPYVDPDTREILGYEARFVADAAVQRFGDPATLLLTEADIEARTGDRLLPASQDDPIIHFQPHAPDTDIEGRILAVIGGVTQIGQFNIVVINKGTADGMEIGHVLKIYQAGERIRDPVKGGIFERVTLPDEEAGMLMVFRSFERVSFALVMKASRAIHIHDFVRTP